MTTQGSDAVLIRNKIQTNIVGFKIFSLVVSKRKIFSVYDIAISGQAKVSQPGLCSKRCVLLDLGMCLWV